jgi:dipeptidyl aminopeptidase/acylaminoacyl peptidase
VSTLLAYALLPQPDPLQAGSSATLTLVVSNGGREAVTCTSITVTIPVGTNAKDLVADASGVVSEPPSGWTCAQNGNQLVLTPQTSSAAEIAGGGLAFVFSGLALNAEPGTSAIAIGELASSPSNGEAERDTTLDVTKFPAAFAVSALTATPTEVSSGGSVTLMWNGSAATYTLWYDPNGEGQRSIAVQKTGPYAVSGLTNAAGVTFTLTATVTVPGQDTPLTAVRQVTVSVSLAPPAIAAFTGTLRNAGTRRPVLTLRWAVTGVEYCFIEIDGVQQTLPAASSMTIAPTPSTPLAAAYTLSATNASGSVSSTLSVEWAPGPPPIVWSNSVPGDTGPVSEPFGNVQCVVAAPDGRHAYVSCRGGVFKIDLVALRSVQMVPLPNDAGAQLAVSPDGGTLYVLDGLTSDQPVFGSPSGALSTIDTRTFATTGSSIYLQFGELPYTGIALTPDGSRLFISGNTYRRILAFDVPSGNSESDIAISEDSVNSLTVSPDGRFLLAWATGHTTIEVLDPGWPEPAGPAISVPGAVVAVAFSPDATTAYVLFAGEAGPSAAIVEVDLTTRAPLGSPVATGNAATSLAVSFDGSRILAGGPGTVSVLTADPLALAATYGTPVVPNPPDAGGVAITPDGVVIVAGAFPTPDAVSLLLPASVTGGVPPGQGGIS